MSFFGAGPQERRLPSNVGSGSDDTLCPNGVTRVRLVGRRRQAKPANLLKTVATLDRFQGLQAPVILASVVSATSGIMHDIWRSNTLSSRAQSEPHLFGRFT